MHANLTNSFLTDRIGRGEDLRTNGSRLAEANFNTRDGAERRKVMKKQKTLAVLLSAAMVAGAIPTAALAEVVGSNSDSGVKAAELSEDQEIEEQNEDSEDEGSGFVLMNVPYDKVYESDIQNDTKVDAVSSATKEKTRKKR